jgi:hypothetical protein
MFDKLSVLHARRARRFARAAIQAFVDMIDKCIRNGQLSLLHLEHLPDAPARRISF